MNTFVLGTVVGWLTMALGLLTWDRWSRGRAMDQLEYELMISHPMGTELPTSLLITPDQWPSWDDRTSGRGPQDGMGHVVETKAGDDCD